MGPILVLTEEVLGSNHNALLFDIIPSNHPTNLPDPVPTGYLTKDKQQQAWVKTFSATLPYKPQAAETHSLDLNGEWMIEGLTTPPCIRMTQPVSYALLGEVSPVGDLEDILNHA